MISVISKCLFAYSKLSVLKVNLLFKEALHTWAQVYNYEEAKPVLLINCLPLQIR